MYSETKRGLTEKEIGRLHKQARKLEVEGRRLPRGFLGCFGFLAAIILVVYWFHSTDQYAGFGTLMALVVLGAITGSAALEEFQKNRGRLRRIQAVIDSGKVLETHIVGSRCFMVEEVDDEGNDYYLDACEYGTLLISDSDIFRRKFPSSDFTVVRTMTAEGKLYDLECTCSGKRLEPILTLGSRAVSDLPELHAYAFGESFTLFPQSFDELLALFSHSTARNQA